MATPTLVQHKGGGGSDNLTGVNNAKYFLENPTLAGNCIVLYLSWTNADGTLSSIVDDGGNTWSTTAATSIVATGGVISGIWRLENCNANTKSITVNMSTAVGNFTMQATEIANVATSGALNGTSAAADVAAPNLACGSFTPTTNNDANGGNIIIAYFRCAKAANPGNSSAPDHFAPGGSFQLLDGECNAGGSTANAFVQHTTQYFVQATQAAINPSVTASGQSTSDTYNCLAIALKAASAGTTYNSANGIHVKRILHYSNIVPGTGTVKFVSPSEGNLRVIQVSQFSGTVVITGITDSDGKTYTPVPNPTAGTYLFYAENCTANNLLTFTITLSGGVTTGGPCRFYDVEFAATSNVLGAHSDATITMPASLRADDIPILTPTQNGSLIIAGGPTASGPIKNNFDPAATNPTPAAAIFDLINYTGETDNDPIDNADALAHYYAPNTNAIHWNWVTGGSSGSTFGVVAAEFKTAPAAIVPWNPHFLGRMQPTEMRFFLGSRFNQASDLSGPLPTQPETNVHSKGRFTAQTNNLLGLLRQNQANDIPAPVQIEAEPHFIGKVSSPSIRLSRLTFQNQANDPFVPLFDQPEGFIWKSAAPIVTTFRGLRENPASDVVGPLLETNAHFIGKFGASPVNILRLVIQNQANDFLDSNPHFIGRFSATIMSSFRSLRENQASDPSFLPTQPETNPHFIGRFTPPQIELLTLLRQNQALDVFRHVVINPNYIGRGTSRGRIVKGLSRWRISEGSSRRRVILGISNDVAQASDLVPPIDDVIEVEATTFDFGLILKPTASIQSIVSVTCSVDQIQVDGVTDPAPQSRLIGPSLIGPSPNSGVASQAVLQLVGTMIGGVLYRLQCIVLTTDGQRLSLWNHILCQTPN